MSHNVLINGTGKPFSHPDTGQLIMPGQSYAEPIGTESTEPTDEEKKVAEKERKAAEKAEKERQKAEEDRIKAEEEAARLKVEEERLKAEADAAASAQGVNTGEQE